MVDRYEELAGLEVSPLDNTNIDQINLFRTWYTRMIQKGGAISNEALIQEFTEEAWEEFCNAYLVYVQEQSQARSEAAATPPPQTPPGQVQQITQAPQQTTFRVSLKDYPITTGKASDWPRYRRKLITTATANGHEE